MQWFQSYVEKGDKKMETLALTETKKISILQDLETTRRSYATRRLKM